MYFVVLIRYINIPWLISAPPLHYPDCSDIWLPGEPTHPLGDTVQSVQP